MPRSVPRREAEQRFRARTEPSQILKVPRIEVPGWRHGSQLKQDPRGRELLRSFVLRRRALRGAYRPPSGIGAPSHESFAEACRAAPGQFVCVLQDAPGIADSTF